jgi:hypothetical protein
MVIVMNPYIRIRSLDGKNTVPLLPLPRHKGRRRYRMKVAASIKGSYQIGIDEYQSYVKTFIFDSSQTIDEILATTKEHTVCALNLSDVMEPQ